MKRALGFMNKTPIAPTYNTYIGGVSASITTASALATKLGISVGAISNFTIVGADINCRITGSYAIPASFYVGITSITYYNDVDGLVSSVGSLAFRYCYSLKYLEVKNATSISDQAFDGDDSSKTMSLEYVYAPLCTSLGLTNGYNTVFRYCYGVIFYCSPSLATNNSGSPDGDISSTTLQSITPRYVTNSTVPSAITTLSAGTIYNTTVQLNFTPPSSTNTIDYYECYADGLFKNKIFASGGYITGLTPSTSHLLEVYAVDIFKNKSLVSNSVTQSTNTTSYLLATTFAAYHLTSNGVDSENGYNGTVGGGVTFSSGAVFTNVSNSNIIVADNNDFTFGNGTNDTPASISFKINFSALGDQWIVNKRGGTSATDEWQVVYYSGVFYFGFLSSSGGYISGGYPFIPTIGVDYLFTFTYNGMGINGFKIYRNGALQTVAKLSSGTYTTMPNGTAPVTIGAMGWSLSSNRLTAKLKELYFNNAELGQTDVDILQTNNYPF